DSQAHPYRRGWLVLRGVSGGDVETLEDRPLIQQVLRERQLLQVKAPPRRGGRHEVLYPPLCLVPRDRPFLIGDDRGLILFKHAVRGVVVPDLERVAVERR